MFCAPGRDSSADPNGRGTGRESWRNTNRTPRRRCRFPICQDPLAVCPTQGHCPPVAPAVLPGLSVVPSALAVPGEAFSVFFRRRCLGLRRPLRPLPRRARFRSGRFWLGRVLGSRFRSRGFGVEGFGVSSWCGGVWGVGRRCSFRRHQLGRGPRAGSGGTGHGVPVLVPVGGSGLGSGSGGALGSGALPRAGIAAADRTAFQPHDLIGRLAPATRLIQKMIATAMTCSTAMTRRFRSKVRSGRMVAI